MKCIFVIISASIDGESCDRREGSFFVDLNFLFLSLWHCLWATKSTGIMQLGRLEREELIQSLEEILA